MNKKASIALATGLLLAGAAAASAAGQQSTSSPKMAPPPASSTMSKPASDTLSLTSTEQKSAWKDLNGHVTNQNAPSGFQPKVGAAVPSSIKLEPIPAQAATDVPSLKSFDFAMVQGKLLIVNPSDKKIADVITG
jgi:hypothetical protein